jgi:uncharacterized protein (DUF1800 family)
MLRRTSGGGTRGLARVLWAAVACCLVWPAAVVRADAIPQLVSAVSRKAHGATVYDIPLPLTGASGIESRRVVGAPTVVLLFDQPVTAGTAAVTAAVGQVAAANPTFSGNAMTVTLSGVPDGQAVTVTASNVRSAAGGTLASAAVTLRTLEGDVNGTGVVSASDINLTKSAAATGVVDGFSFRSDIDFNGVIGATDINLVKAKAATTSAVDGGPAANTPPTVGDVPDQAGASGVAGQPIAFAVADAETAAGSLGVRVTSSDPALVPDAGMAMAGSGATRTLTITPAAGLTGTATITVLVGDGMAIVSDTFTLTVSRPPTLFAAYLRPQGTSATPGSGFATLLLSGDETKAELKATYANLTTPEVAKHIHGPAGPTQSANIIFDIDTAAYDEAKQTWTWDIGPVGTLTAADVLAAIKSGNTYINVHSSRFPNGEIRGQFLLATGSQTFAAPPPPPPLPGGPPTAQDAARFLQQATFGPTLAEIAVVQASGYDAWLAAQFATPVSRLVAQPANNGFESPVAPAGGFVANPAGAGWTFEGAAGVAANASVYTSPPATQPTTQPTTQPATQPVAIVAPAGVQAAYLQSAGRVRQTLTVSQPGRYLLTFLAAPRTNAGTPPTLLAKVDGAQVGSYPLPATLPSSDLGRYDAFKSAEFTLAAGDHELAFEAVGTGVDDTALVDDVRLSVASSAYGVVRQRLGAEVDAANGATRNIEGWWRSSVTGEDQLRQRVAFALSQLFVVSMNDGSVNGRPLALANYYDMLADDAFGNFRTLLKDVTLHPIMGQYLNMRGNRKPFSPLFTAPNENYAREIQQLFTVGLNQLQPDGTLKLGPDGLPIPTYDQKTIEGFANVFTGWNVVASTAAVKTPVLKNVNVTTNGVTVQVRRMQVYNDDYSPAMIVTAANHSNTAKTLLNGFTLAANASHTTATATAELDAALDNLFNHPNVGPFVCRQLIQRLVTSNPSPGYVYRTAQVFANDGTGARGNMQAVVKAILTDYEARSPDVLSNQGFGRLREPVVRAAAVMRAHNPTSISGLFKVSNTDTALGQTPLKSPTVFNFYEPFYVHPGQLADAGLYAPEFQISTEIMAINIPNFLQVGVYNSNAASLPTFQGGDLRLNLAYEQSLAGNPAALVDHLNLVLMSGQMSAAVRQKVIDAVTVLAGTTDAQKLVRARLAVYLVATSTQCAVQK